MRVIFHASPTLCKVISRVKGGVNFRAEAVPCMTCQRVYTVFFDMSADDFCNVQSSLCGKQRKFVRSPCSSEDLCEITWALCVLEHFNPATLLQDSQRDRVC